jgi:hypothetical protein
MSIETNQYIASAADVEKLAHTILEADITATGARGTFLKAVVGTTQAELGSPPRMRNTKGEKLDEETTKAHLAAFENVAKRFTEAVNKAAQAMEPKPDADMMRSRTAFARSALSTVRGFIRASGDIRALAAHKVTKASLATPKTKRKFSVDALKKRAVSMGEQLMSIAKNLQAANSAEARETVTTIMAQLAKAAGIAEHTTKDVDKAIEAGEAFHTKTGVFFPINLAAIREQRAAA